MYILIFITQRRHSSCLNLTWRAFVPATISTQHCQSLVRTQRLGKTFWGLAEGFPVQFSEAERIIVSECVGGVSALWLFQTHMIKYCVILVFASFCCTSLSQRETSVTLQMSQPLCQLLTSQLHTWIPDLIGTDRFFTYICRKYFFSECANGKVHYGCCWHIVTPCANLLVLALNHAPCWTFPASLKSQCDLSNVTTALPMVDFPAVLWKASWTKAALVTSHVESRTGWTWPFSTILFNSSSITLTSRSWNARLLAELWINRVSSDRGSWREGYGPPTFKTAKSKCVFNKHTIKVCISCSWQFPGPSAPSAAHLTVSWILCSSKSNARGESRAHERRRICSKSLEGSKMEMMELLGGMEEKSLSPTWGQWFALLANQ